MDAQLVLWTRYELTQVFGPSTPQRTKIRPSPGRQTSARVDQHPSMTTKNQQVRGCMRPRNAGQRRPLTDLRRLIGSCVTRPRASCPGPSFWWASLGWLEVVGVGTPPDGVPTDRPQEDRQVAVTGLCRLHWH